MSTGEYGKVPIDPERPWPGLLSFPEGAARLFHGRTREVSELLRLLDSEPVTFLYGKSGLGKTSLLQAGLFPRLRERDRLPVYLRLSHDPSAPTPRQQLFRAITEAMDLATIDGPRPDAAESAWAYFHRRDVEWWSPRNRLVRPVIVIDQFEELFTLGQETPEARDRSAATIELLHELTTRRPGAEQRRAFDDEPDAIEAFDYDAARYQVLFAFREDFLPQFDQLREPLRINPHNRLALERLTGADARESVLGTGGSLVDAGVAETIVRFVAGDRREDARPLDQLEVEPWLLCLVCEQLNERRLRATPVPRRISDDLLTGSRDEILAQYYTSCVAGLDPRVPAFLEDRLLTEGGYRNPYPYDEAIRLDGITPRVIDELVDRRLVRREQQMGTQRLEVTHDVLGPVMLKYRQQRQSRERDAIARLRVIADQRRAAEGRRRSGQLVVGATIIVTLLSVFALLRSREARRAESLFSWGRETQTHTYTALLQVLRQTPVDPTVRSSVGELVNSTRELRRRLPADPLLTSQELQYTFLASRAWADSALGERHAMRVLELADSLAAMPNATGLAADAEFSYRLASIVAGERRDSVRMQRNLVRRVALIDDPSLPDFNLEKSASAAMELAAMARDAEGRLALLERSVLALSLMRRSTPRQSTVDSLVRATSDLAATYRSRVAADSATVRRSHVAARSAQSIRADIAEERFEDDTTSQSRRAAHISALGNLGWWYLLAGDFALSVSTAERALELDPTQDWIVQNRNHARLFLGYLDDMEQELQRLAGTQLKTTTGSYAGVALQDIQVFRQARLSHPDLERYERLFLSRK